MAEAFQSDLFTEPSAAKHEEAIAAVIPIAQQLARRAGANGVTVADVRVEAQRRGLIKNQNTEDRTRSFFGAVMKRAGLVPTDRTRRAEYIELAHSHGNRHVVWVDSHYHYADDA